MRSKQTCPQDLVPGVLKGLNATVFAYGATGSGKTHTMVGDASDPGLMVLGMNDIFTQIVGPCAAARCCACLLQSGSREQRRVCPPLGCARAEARSREWSPQQAPAAAARG